MVMKPPNRRCCPRFVLRNSSTTPAAGRIQVVPGGKEAGAALASHPGVAMIALIGSAPTGRAVMKAASDTLKAVMLELGGRMR